MELNSSSNESVPNILKDLGIEQKALQNPFFPKEGLEDLSSTASTSQLPGVIIPAYNPNEKLLELVKEIILFNIPFIVIVNDGSDTIHQQVFHQIQKFSNVHLINHPHNLGKGQALKTAFRYIQEHFPESIGIITADADGQHLPKDIAKMAHALTCDKNSFFIGVRQFGTEIPARSLFGNVLTKYIFRILLGKKIQDTQTGLRGIPINLLPQFLNYKTSGYDFEMEMLVKVANMNVSINEIPISTVYEDNNKSSHFNLFRDSFKIYFVFLRFIFTSMLTYIMDFSIFSLSHFLGVPLFLCLVLGRIFAGFANFKISKKYVFKSDKKFFNEFHKYLLSVLFFGILTYYSINLLINHFAFNTYLAKILVETSIFILNFFIQRAFVFKTNSFKENLDMTKTRPKATDWTFYYSKPGKFTSITRKITFNYLLKSFRKYPGDVANSRVMEMGGGNSCFYNMLKAKFNNLKYSIADSNALSLRKFQENQAGAENVSLHNIDLLKDHTWERPFDICFSVGLIEHFDHQGTAKIIKSHFDSVAPGGLIIMTFPTPSLTYNLIRKIAELLNVWIFHDERPLIMEEVIKEAEKYGKIISTKINWWILLTQGIVVAQKSG